MSLETLSLLVVIGLIAGCSLRGRRRGLGLIGDIVVGVVGAFVGGLIFDALDIGTPFADPLHHLRCFIGAIALLPALCLTRLATTERAPPARRQRPPERSASRPAVVRPERVRIGCGCYARSGSEA